MITVYLLVWAWMFTWSAIGYICGKVDERGYEKGQIYIVDDNQIEKNEELIKWSARMTLLSFIWPLALVGVVLYFGPRLFFKGFANLWRVGYYLGRGFGSFFKDVTGRNR